MPARRIRVQLSPAAAWSLLAAYAAIIFYVSSLSDPLRVIHVPSGPVPHAIEFSGLGLLLFVTGTVQPFGPRPWRFVAMVALGWLYAASDEWHQSFVPGRTCELADWLVDAAAVLAAVVVLALLERRGRLRVRRPRPD